MEISETRWVLVTESESPRVPNNTKIFEEPVKSIRWSHLLVRGHRIREKGRTYKRKDDVWVKVITHNYYWTGVDGTETRVGQRDLRRLSSQRTLMRQNKTKDNNGNSPSRKIRVRGRQSVIW